MNTSLTARTLFFSNLVLLAVLWLPFSAHRVAAQGYTFKMIDQLAAGSHDEFGVLDFNDWGDVLYFIKDINLYDAYLHRNDSTPRVWDGDGRILMGSANHSGDIVLVVDPWTGEREVILGKVNGLFSTVAKEYHLEQFQNLPNGYQSGLIKSGTVWDVRINEAGVWAMAGETHDRFGAQSNPPPSFEMRGAFDSKTYSGLFGADFSHRSVRHSGYSGVITPAPQDPTNGKADGFGGGDQLTALVVNRNLDLAAVWTLYEFKSGDFGGWTPTLQSSLGIDQSDVYSFMSDAIVFGPPSLSDNGILVAFGHPANGSRGFVYQFGGGINGEHSALNRLISDPLIPQVNNRGDILLQDLNDGSISIYQDGVLKPVYAPGMAAFGAHAISFTLARGCFNNRGQIAGVMTLDDGRRVVVRGEPLVVRLKALEVVQSIQDWKNSVPLLEGKKTYARAHLEATKPGDVGKNLTARLVGKLADGTKLGEVLPSKAPWNHRTPFGLSADAHKARSALNRTLNFELPAGWTKGTVTLSLEALDFASDKQDPAEPGGAANDGTVNVTFQPPTKLRLFVVPVDVKDLAGLRVPAPTSSDIESSLEVARQALPVSMLTTRRVSAKHFTLPAYAVLNPNNRFEFQQLALTVAKRARKEFGAGAKDIIVAALATDVQGKLKSGETGNATAIPSQQLWSVVTGHKVDRPALAHELGHALGSYHPTDTTQGIIAGQRLGYCEEVSDPEPGKAPGDRSQDYPYFYPYYGACTLINPPPSKFPFLGPLVSNPDGTINEDLSAEGIGGLDLHRATTTFMTAVNPLNSVELMSYCDFKCGVGDSWAGLKTYTDVLAYLRAHPRSEASPTPIVLGRLGGTLVVGGSLNTLSNTVVWQPVHCFPGEAPLSDEPGPYRVEARDAASNLLSQATFQIGASPESFDPDSRWRFPFLIELPADPRLELLQVWHETNLLSSLTGGAHTPEVTVLSPNGGEKFEGETVEFRWQGADADGDALVYNVQLSSDGGNTWHTLALQTVDTNLVVDSEGLASSTNALLRVLVSDGFRTAEDQSDGKFSVVGGGPLVSWLYPSPGEVLYGDEDNVLRALVDGRGGEEITETNLVWRSDRDGVLGTGSELPLNPPLTPGTHLITLTATDSHGNVTVVSNTVVVYAYAPPLLGLPGFQTNGTMTLAVGGSAPSQVVIETSTNLVQWEEWRTVLLEESYQVITGAIGTNETARFFRVRAGTSAPTFIRQPDDVALAIGDTLQLNAEAISAEPVVYYWSRNGSPVGGVGNGPTLTITNLPVAQGGLYSVVASNRLGTATSREATVACRVAFATALTNICYQGGSNFTFQCHVVGSAPLAYQWFKDGAAIVGATNENYGLAAMATNDLGVYKVQVTNQVSTAYGFAVLYGCPTIINAHLTNQCYVAGQSVTFHIGVTGSGPFTYAWYKNSTLIQDATGATYTIPSATPDDLGNYSVTAYNGAGNGVGEEAALKECP